MANVRDLARKDWQRFSASSMNLEITLTAPNAETVTAKGIGTNNFIKFETDGQDVLGKVVHIGIHIKNLLEANPNYPIYNSKNLVDLDKHKVSFLDSEDVTRNYTIQNFMPDLTTGMIMADCELHTNVTQPSS